MDNKTENGKNTVTLYRQEFRTGGRTREAWVAYERNSVYDETVKTVETAAFMLPPGYRFGETQSGEPAIFDHSDQYCHIETHSSGRPQLNIHEDGARRPVLYRVGETPRNKEAAECAR